MSDITNFIYGVLPVAVVLVTIVQATTIIGWFTTMTMIRNILIITVIADLVPTAMSK